MASIDNNHDDLVTGSLVKRTLRTVSLLVAACVIFVGLLSAAAVAITSRALNPDRPDGTAHASEATGAGAGTGTDRGTERGRERGTDRGTDRAPARPGSPKTPLSI